MKKAKSKKNIKKSNFKIILGALGLITLVASATLGAAACAPKQTNQKIIDKGDDFSFAKNDLNNLNYTIEDGVRTALSNPDGTQALFNAEYEELLYSIINNFKVDNVVLTNKVQNEVDSIDEAYKNFIEGLNLSGRDLEIAIQKELDQYGGTEESWKKTKILQWAKSFIEERLFSNDYSNIINVSADGTKTTLNSPDRTAITTALFNKVNGIETGYQLGFGSKSNTGDGIFSQKFVDANVALQEKIFNMYIQDEKPFVLNMNLWKYSTDGVGNNSDDVWLQINPVEGGTDEEGNPLPPPSAAGTYQAPFFSSQRTEDSKLTPVEKFNNFNNANISNVPGVNETLINFVPATVNGLNNISMGLREEMKINWTDDSSNYILVEPKSWSLVNEFMLASMSLFNLDNSLTSSMFSSNIFKSTPGNFVNDAVINEEFDLISRSFMAKTKPIGVNSAMIKNEDLKRMLNRNNPDLNSLFASSDNIWSIDAFHSDNPNTNDFIYLRNEFGVHAIALDGWEYIKTGTTFDERISKAGDILLYRSIQNRENSGDASASEPTKNFSVPLMEKLKSYYNANLLKIWTSIFKTSKSDPISQAIVNNFLGADVAENSFSDSEIALFEALYFYLEQKNQSNNVDTRNLGLLTTKSKYSVTSGVNSYRNGIASPYIFGQDQNGSFNEVLMFLNKGKTLNKINDQRSRYNALIANINSYITANQDAIKPLKAQAASFAYSQTILASDLSINKVLKSFTTNTDYYSNVLTNQAVENAILFGNVKVGDVITISDTAPTGNLNPVTFDLSMYGFNLAQMEEFNFQFVNNFLGKNVTQATIGNDIRSYVNVANPQGSISVNEVQEYKQKQYFKDTYSNNLSFQTTKENLLMLALGLNFMLEDNDGDGVFGDRFLQRVKSELSINESASFVWWNNFSLPLVPSPTLNLINSSEKLLLQDKAVPSSMFLNQNNNLNSQYITNNGTYLDTGTASGIFNNVYQNTGYGQTNSFQYNVAKDNKLLNGYTGLQKESSTSIPVDVKEYVFPTGKRQTGPTSEAILQGSLYQYGSRSSLLNVINANQNVAEINKLAISIRNKIDNSEVTSIVQNIIENSSLDKKQELLNNLVSNTTLIPEISFKNYSGFANGSQDNGVLIQGKDNFTSYGAYSQQVNFEDLNYQKNSTTGDVILENGKPVEINSLNQLAENIGSSLMLDILLNYASESANQTTAFNAIGRNNQFVIYDTNTRNALGEIWVKNYDLE